MNQTDPSTSAKSTPFETGGCLCGAVRYQCTQPMREVVNCHCRMCQRTHGHIAAYTAIPRDHLILKVTRGLTWYASSDKARRGFCCQCGASLFWEPADDAYIAISAGTLDDPAGLTTVRHIYTAEAGGYYAITDDIEQFPGSMRA